jgi:hypothetical protein
MVSERAALPQIPKQKKTQRESEAGSRQQSGRGGDQPSGNWEAPLRGAPAVDGMSLEVCTLKAQKDLSSAKMSISNQKTRPQLPAVLALKDRPRPAMEEQSALHETSSGSGLVRDAGAQEEQEAAPKEQSSRSDLARSAGVQEEEQEEEDDLFLVDQEEEQENVGEDSWSL